VRLVGSVPLSSDDRDSCSSSELVERHVRRLCGRQQADNDVTPPPPPYGVVYYWPTVSAASCFRRDSMMPSYDKQSAYGFLPRDAV